MEIKYQCILEYWNSDQKLRSIFTITRKLLTRFMYLDNFLDLSYSVLNCKIAFNHLKIVHSGNIIMNFKNTDLVYLMFETRLFSSFLAIIIILKVLNASMMLDKFY